MIDRVVNVCENNKKKLKSSDILYKLFYEAFRTRTNISNFCPLDPGVYGFFNFKFDDNKMPLQLFRTKYIFTFVGTWYTMIKVEGSKKLKKVNAFYVNISYQVEE